MLRQAGSRLRQTALEFLYYLPYWRGKGKLTLALLRGYSPVAAKMPFGGRIWIGADPERQTLLPYWIGQYESHILSSFSRQMKTMRDGASIVDVGANLGFYTVVAAGFLRQRGRGKVFAFEPNPRAYAEIVANVALNGFTNVEISPNAVASTIGPTEFFSNPEGITLGSLKPAVNARVTHVARTTLDALREHSGHIGLIKIDVEGAELLVLQGARHLLELDRPAVIFEEFDNAYHGFGYSNQDVHQYFQDLEYSLYWIRGQFAGHVSLIDPDIELAEETVQYRNLLALPKEHK